MAPTYNKGDMMNCCQGIHDIDEDTGECRVCGYVGQPMPPIYLVTYNHDYNESAVAFHTRAEAVADIANNFDCESEPDTPEFWKEVSDIYEASNWKGFQFLKMDQSTLAVTDAGETPST